MGVPPSPSGTRPKSDRPRAVKDGSYSDPIYKKLSIINGEINKMSREQLIQRCQDLKLDIR